MSTCSTMIHHGGGEQNRFMSWHAHDFHVQTTVVGSVSNVRFVNITATSENGIFLAGSIVSKKELINININLKRWTQYTGGLVDYKLGCKGLVHHHTAGISMECISDVIMKSVNMTWVLNKTAGWNLPMDFTPSTVKKIYLADFQSVLYK
eukprot:Gb_09851 [translate_table: standard]